MVKYTMFIAITIFFCVVFIILSGIAITTGISIRVKIISRTCLTMVSIRHILTSKKIIKTTLWSISMSIGILSIAVRIGSIIGIIGAVNIDLTVLGSILGIHIMMFSIFVTGNRKIISQEHFILFIKCFKERIVIRHMAVHPVIQTQLPKAKGFRTNFICIEMFKDIGFKLFALILIPNRITKIEDFRTRTLNDF